MASRSLPSGLARVLGLAALSALCLLAPAAPAGAGECLHPYYWQATSGQSPEPNNCFGSSGFRCYRAIDSAWYFALENPACDPQTEPCVVHLRVPLETPGVEQMVAEDGLAGSPTPVVYWFAGATAPPCPGSQTDCGQEAICGTLGFGGKINVDFWETWIERPGVTCANAGTQTGTYSVRVMVCRTACREDTTVDGMTFATPQLAADIGCPPPPPPPPASSCAGDAECETCTPGGLGVGGGGAPAGGAGPGGPFGPGAELRYLAGGAGHPGLPGSDGWTATLGRHWSHDYAERIVPDPDPSHVWLVTRYATFREWTDGDGDGTYETVAPSDEYRTLVHLGGSAGWELTDLDGTVDLFDGDGRWLSRTDRNGNAKTATYDGSGRLGSVAFPDGRREDFAYDAASGKLASITEVGVDGTSTHLWSYTWSGDDLVRVDRPDGRAWELTYGEAAHPGYLTLLELVGTGGGRRVEGAWTYDAAGNAVAFWRGDLAETGTEAVERWRLAFDDPETPATTTVTDPLGAVATYTVGRDPASPKARVLSISGDCPACGLGPNVQMVYGDPAHPLLPTRRFDGRGVETQLAYDAAGRLVARTEAVGTPEERTTTWSHDPAYPGLAVELERPSTAGAGSFRRATWSRDAAGNATSASVEGVEAGSAFLYTTTTTYNAAGRPLTVDPPGHGTADQVHHAYDPARGDLVPVSRTDPLIGTTTFGHDAFNRRTEVTDPNGLLVETEYDPLGRVVRTIARGASPAEDLTTEHVYDGLGELLRTVLPAGNVVEYGYDAAGRLISIERKPDPATPGERVLYTLDPAGNRVREEHQSWDGAGWTSASWTDFVFTTRCRLDRVVHADGSVREHAYDCNGNLERTWDEAHSRFPADPPVPPPPPDADPATLVAASHAEAPATTVFRYDPLDRLIAVEEPWPDGTTATTEYRYDVQDHLAAVVDAEGNETTYVTSDRDLLTREESPVSGTTTHAYDENGERIETVDARGVLVLRTVDPLGRVTAIDYPDPALDTTFTYDDPAVAFSLGRLTAIDRPGTSVAYEYDRFGRTTRDGELTYGYDPNGNRTSVGYPDGTTATYGFDFADRPTALEITPDPAGGAGPAPVVTGASYLPGGPLASLALGNGLAETRGHDARYRPTAVDVPGLLALTYEHDPLGNVTAADRTTAAGTVVGARYGYQPVQSFLTAAHGPWGRRHWTYDTIGNRLTEGPPGSTAADSDLPPSLYTYGTNPAGGHTPQLLAVDPPAGSGLPATAYAYDAAGHQVQVDATGDDGTATTALSTYGDDGRLLRVEDAGGSPASDFLYDGRSFLAAADLADPAAGSTVSTTAVYGSDGRLMSRTRTRTDPAPEPPGDVDPLADPVTSTRTTHLLYFAGRPVAQLSSDPTAPGSATLLYLTPDHLGAPILATDATGALAWEGGLSPFGTPYTLGDPTDPGGDPADPGDDLDDPNDPPLPPPPPDPPPPDNPHDPTPPPPGDPGDPGPPDGRDGGGGNGGGSPASDDGLDPDGRPQPRSGRIVPHPARATLEELDLFLRLPGQWEDAAFGGGWAGGRVYYNVHRWYQPEFGAYSRPDPLGRDGDPHPYQYALGNPLSFFDLVGLKVRVCCKPIPPTVTASVLLDVRLGTKTDHKRHCFFEFGDGSTIGLHGPMDPTGVLGAIVCQAQGEIQERSRGQAGFDQRTDLPSSCSPWDECGDECVRQAAEAYPEPSKYCLFGPNSNTFAGSITRKCSLSPPPVRDVLNAPGWFDGPPD